MSSVNRLLVCLRCTASRLSVTDAVLKQPKFSLWGTLLVNSRAETTASWPLFTRAFNSQCSSSQLLIRGYRTARRETTSFAQNTYDENEVCMRVLHGTEFFRCSRERKFQ